MNSIFKLTFLLLLSFVFAQNGNGEGKACTENAECNPCLANSRLADFVFQLDASGSMAYEINLVKDGLSTFVTALQNNEIDSRFAIVLFGRWCEVVLDFETDLSLILAAFEKIRSSAPVDGFQLHHCCQESAFECTAMILGRAEMNDLDRDYVGGPVDYEGMDFRPLAIKYIFLVTDEDSDKPYYDLNKLAGMELGNANKEPPTDFTDDSAWAMDRFRAAQAVVAESVIYYALFSILDSPAQYQFGDYNADVSSPDFSNWDPVATLDNLNTAGLQNTFQAQILKRGGFCRGFNILNIEEPNFITNFFQSAVEITTLCEGEASCFISVCDPVEGCIDTPVCERIINGENECYRNCFIDDTCYGFADSNPVNACQVCVPGENRWGDCDDGDACTNNICDEQQGCTYEQICSAACGKCSIGGECFEAFSINPQDSCDICEPDTNADEWTRITWVLACNPDIVIDPTLEDRDGDGFSDNLDFCPDTYYPIANIDTDADGMGDICDPCPNDPANVDVCGNDQPPAVEQSPSCSNQGTCNCGVGTTMICECNEGFYGDKCQFPVTCPNDCNGKGVCQVAANNRETECVCEEGFSGEACVPAVCSGGCINGECIADFVCRCDPGYIGEICFNLDPDFDYPACGNDCFDRGNCTAKSPTEVECDCDEGFSGDQCEKDNETGEILSSATSLFASFFSLLIASFFL